MRGLVLLLLLLTLPLAAQTEDPNRWVELDGHEILRLSDAPGQPASERVHRLEAGLVKLLENPHAETLGARVSGDRYELVSGDLVLAEIFESDATSAGLNRKETAEFWAFWLQDYLNAVRAERAGLHWRRALGNTALNLGLALLLHIIMGRVLPRLHIHSVIPRAVIWLTALSLSFIEFPETRTAGNVLLAQLILPLWWVCGVIVVASLLSRALNRSLDLYFDDLEKFWRQRPDLHPRPQRVRMLRSGVGVVAQTILFLTAAVIAGRMAGLDLGAAVAGAGFIGVGLSLVARDLLADWFAGAQIVAEDQFGVGDTITVGPHTGEVELFTLRATRLRLEDGSFVNVSNSQVRTVINHATSNVAIVAWTVARSAELTDAIAKVEAVAQQVAKDLELSGEPTLAGVSSVEKETVTVRVLMPVEPERAAAVRAELLHRLTVSF